MPESSDLSLMTDSVGKGRFPMPCHRSELIGSGITGCYGSPFINEGRMAMSVEKLVEHFSALEDPRCSGKVDHRLIDILVIAVCAVIACAESWDDIALYGRNKLGWLRSFLSLA